MFKKVLSVFLAITILFAALIMPASASADNQVTVHFYNENNWSNPYIYYYDSNKQPLSWPGIAMENDGDGWYSYTISNMSQARVIFSDNGANQYPELNQEGLLVEGEKWYKSGAFYDTKPQTENVKIHYYNENNWSSPYLYYYNSDNQPVTWPGKAMNNDGNGWYSYTINNMSQAKVIFSNNGANQNPAQNQGAYSVSGEKWYVNGSWHDSEPEGITVHFYNYDNWNNVNIYYYLGDRSGTDWTGVPMTADGDGWYTYKIYGYEQANVLFNNGGSIQIPGRMEPGFSVSDEMWYRNGEWTKKRPDEITVYFYKPSGWNTPNLYYYKNDTDTGKVWPGNVMKECGNNWYSYTITKYSSAKVLFNSGNTQIPAQNQPGFDATGIMWYKDGVWCDSQTDTDRDELPDYMEMILGTNLHKADTDGDKLPDGYEVMFLDTDPKNADSNYNGINDGAEDADSDKLTNLHEYVLKTDPKNADTDGDGLNDCEEVNQYYSDPLLSDTDGDTLSDGDDVALGFDPTLQDTDGNGILDCDEKVQQSMNEEIICKEQPEITDVSVSFSGTENIQKTTTIENIYDIDIMSSGVVGLIGAPVEINSTSDFDEAVITFKYDETQLGDTPEENLAIMWYDEENQLYQILDQDTVVDTQKNTLSYTTTHFSKYMVVDKEIWYNTWRNTIDYRSGSVEKTYFDFAFVVDTSGSMSGNSISYAKTAMNNFIDCLADDDNGCLISFANNASLLSPLGSTKAQLHSGVNSLYASGGTRVSAGLSMGVNQLIGSSSGNEKAIILICDGDVDNVESIVNTAVANNIKIFTINVVASSHTILQSIADRTGGEYYYAYTAEQLLDAFSHISSESLFDFDLTDSDDDGLPDTFETNGMRVPNGRIIYTDPNKYDTDGDSFSDGDEMGVLRSAIPLPLANIGKLPGDQYYIGNGLFARNIMFFDWISDPTLGDTDGDGLLDNEARFVNGKKVAPKDPDPLKINGPAGIWQAQIEREIKGNIPHTYSKNAVLPDFTPPVGAEFAKYIVDFALENRDLLLDNEELIRKLAMGVKSVFEGSAAAGAYLLNFKLDEQKLAYHSQVESWQRAFGYNDMYDDVFRIGSNMLNEQFTFTSNGQKHVLWAWKGDYWNLQSGAEIGLYSYDRAVNNTNHYNVVDFTLPMTLNLYNYYSKSNIDNVFSWAPDENQWWITGFNTRFTEPNPDDMVVLGSIDFTGRESMYNDFRNDIINGKKAELKDYTIFDDDSNTVWIVW